MGRWHVERANGDTGAEAWPRVAIVHSFYRSDAPSGENATVMRQFRMLADAGVDVTLLSVYTDELQRRLGYELTTAINVVSGRGMSPVEKLRSLSPDIIHVHNLFPNVATDWLDSSTAAIVTTLHNYRPLCSAATLSRNGRDCTLCIDRSSWNAVKYACYHGSRLATLPLAVRNRRGPASDPVLSGSDMLLAPSETVKRTYEQAGITNIRILRQPTEARVSANRRDDGGALFLGRLSADKGILNLLQAWPASRRLTVIGKGPLERDAVELAAVRGLDVDFRGFVSDEELTELLGSARVLVFPSTWREGAPAVYAEALSVGVPVLAVAGNAVADAVAADATGVVIPNLGVTELTAGLREIDEHWDALSTRARHVYGNNYTIDHWLEGVNAAYRDAIALRRSRISLDMWGSN